MFLFGFFLKSVIFDLSLKFLTECSDINQPCVIFFYNRFKLNRSHSRLLYGDILTVIERYEQQNPANDETYLYLILHFATFVISRIMSKVLFFSHSQGLVVILAQKLNSEVSLIFDVIS